MHWQQADISSQNCAACYDHTMWILYCGSMFFLVIFSHILSGNTLKRRVIVKVYTKKFFSPNVPRGEPIGNAIIFGPLPGQKLLLIVLIVNQHVFTFSFHSVPE